MSHPTLWKHPVACIALAAASALAVSAAWASGASLSGPSIAAASSMVPLTAKSLPASSAVTVAVAGPSGREAHYSHVSSAEGSLAVNVKVSESGNYKVRVLDSAGRELASTMFIAQ